MTKQHSHNFVEEYDGLLAQGFDKETDLATLKVYLQKFSDDKLLDSLLPRLKDEEIKNIFFLISTTLKKHLTDNEYHHLFLKE